MLCQGREVERDVRRFDEDDATWWELRLPGGYLAALVRK